MILVQFRGERSKFEISSSRNKIRLSSNILISVYVWQHDIIIAR